MTIESDIATSLIEVGDKLEAEVLQNERWRSFNKERNCRFTLTDKLGLHRDFLHYYDKLFSPYKQRPVTVLEVGTYRGGFLNMLGEYFRHGVIYGIDPKFEPMILDSICNVVFIKGDGEDPGLANEFDSEYFDFIIDDANHRLETQVTIFSNYFSKLKRGGTYIIEDIQDLDEAKGELFALFKRYNVDPGSINIIDLRRIPIPRDRDHVGNPSKDGRYDNVLITVTKRYE